ncbi:HEAT repeat domain-containing protein [uncultured Sphingomonas sp.]|uniref:HEAT repeat domain-containing protein n=1 Tax=uncultured Sphingomonas sp. TaxID=158754 RepID=UPI0025E5D29F|nr:HEAT repeat domain-containing protein [uncultured Sphingomonas sp.]
MPYEPTSGFLIDVVNEAVPLSGSAFADHNLRRVIDYLTDAEAVNRDWAAFILGYADLDTPTIRDALLTAATTDCSRRVRAEALRGLAQIAPALALPHVREALSADRVLVNVFEAPEIVADPSLVEALRQWSAPSDDPHLDELVPAAIAACERGKAA